MSGEAKLREALASIFDPYDWCNGDTESQCWVNPGEIMEQVISQLKQGEWLITGGSVNRVHFAGYDGAAFEYGDGRTSWRVVTYD